MTRVDRAVPARGMSSLEWGRAPVEEAEDDHWGVFATANSGGLLQDYKSQSGGVTAGASYKWCENLSTGVYAGY